MAKDGYEWDTAKALANRRKHGVRFSEAVIALEDPFSIARTVDQDHLLPARNACGTAALSGAVMRDEYDFSNARRGPIRPLPHGKTRITIRLDDDVVEWFKAEVEAAGGGNYQTSINRALQEHIRRSRESLEETLRRVLREELKVRK